MSLVKGWKKFFFVRDEWEFCPEKQQKRPSLSESDNEDIKKLFEIPDKEGSLSSLIDKNKVYELKYTSGQVVEALWWLPTDSSTNLFWLASTWLSHTTIADAVFDPIEKAMVGPSSHFPL
ncbi:hypothetical protein Fot_34862 [Forsythia ovata]|uniref:Uncharacterized protein n=1 Tax=Forsythia ovata TaxID=205694 RepID=A0ABD1SLB3_9LAMI